MRIILFILLISAFVLSGCKSNKPTVARGVSDQEKKESLALGDNQAIFVDQDLTEKIKIVEYKLSRNDMGMLNVRVKVHAFTDEDVQLDVMCKFEHTDGTVQKTPWEPKIVKRHETEVINFTSLSPEAEKYNLYFRFGR